MLKDVVEVRAGPGSRLYVRFEDGVSGELDVSTLVRFEGVFAPLQDPAVFAQAAVNADTGTVCWPGGADLDPVVLYAKISGAELPGDDESTALRVKNLDI